MSASITSGTYPRAARSTSGGLPAQGLGARLWRALTRAGAHRAHPELMRMARLKAQTDPVLAQQLRDAARELMQS
jgi:hypothetical protein